MVHPEVLRRRLQKIDEYVAYLDRAQNYSLEELDVDIERLYEILQNERDDIQRIADTFNRFL